MIRNENTFWRKFSKTFMWVNLFGEEAEFQIKGNKSFPNWQEILLSLGIFTISLSYAVNKFHIMIDHGDTYFQQTTLKDFIPVEKEFTFE